MTSIEVPGTSDETYGNRLYWNRSDSAGVRFERDVTGSGLKDGGWGWASCAGDFNNDGWLDIFHVNGYGRIPEEYADTSLGDYIESYNYLFGRFQDLPSRLFINNADLTFADQAAAWGWIRSRRAAAWCASTMTGTATWTSAW